MNTSSPTYDPPLLQPSPLHVSELFQAACDYVERATKLSLDQSEESLAYVDHYVRTLRGDKTPSDAVLDLVSAALGVYLGELLLSRFGGRWLAIPTMPEEPASETAVLDSISDPATWRIELSCAPLLCDPVLWARQALAFATNPSAGLEGDAESGDAESGGLHVHPSHEEFVAKALARMAPVREETFYSFTGRFETVCYVVELLQAKFCEPREENLET